MSSKVVPMLNSTTAISSQTVDLPRGMSREERRIIFEKLHAVYVSEEVGYAEDWSDEKVANDIKAPRAWVSIVREEMFGPDVNEQSVKLIAEAKALLDEIKTAKQSMDALISKAETIEQALQKLEPRRG